MRDRLEVALETKADAAMKLNAAEFAERAVVAEYRESATRLRKERERDLEVAQREVRELREAVEQTQTECYAVHLFLQNHCLGVLPHMPTVPPQGEVRAFGVRVVANLCATRVRSVEDLVRVWFEKTSATNHGPKDGPGEQGKFFWKGDFVSFNRAPLRYRLCEALWDAVRGVPRDERLEDEVINAIYWSNRNDDSEDNLKDVAKNINKAFENKGWGLRVSRGNAKIWLEVLA
jgi:hypothetical protein